jgi:hypothetical protein
MLVTMATMRTAQLQTMLLLCRHALYRLPLQEIATGSQLWRACSLSRSPYGELGTNRVSIFYTAFVRNMFRSYKVIQHYAM